MIRYKTRPDAANENARLVAAVYAALAEADPGEFRYITYRLSDGVTFVHVAHHEGETNPLSSLSAFAEFQKDLANRCVEPPQPMAATIVGAYGWGQK